MIFPRLFCLLIRGNPIILVFWCFKVHPKSSMTLKLYISFDLYHHFCFWQFASVAKKRKRCSSRWTSPCILKVML